jgi:hypothetical protein
MIIINYHEKKIKKNKDFPLKNQIINYYMVVCTFYHHHLNGWNFGQTSKVSNVNRSKRSASSSFIVIDVAVVDVSSMLLDTVFHVAPVVLFLLPYPVNVHFDQVHLLEPQFAVAFSYASCR